MALKKHMYRGYEVSSLIDLTRQELMAKVKKATKEAAGLMGKKPDIIKTHLRNMVILPEMQGAQIGCHNGRGFLLVEVKPGMIGNYLGEHSITYKPVKHGHVSKNFH